jgi:hypothetical protein
MNKPCIRKNKRNWLGSKQIGMAKKSMEALFCGSTISRRHSAARGSTNRALTAGEIIALRGYGKSSKVGRRTLARRWRKGLAHGMGTNPLHKHKNEAEIVGPLDGVWTWKKEAGPAWGMFRGRGAE